MVDDGVYIVIGRFMIVAVTDVSIVLFSIDSHSIVVEAIYELS
jgi:hypothetical protein